MPPPVKLHDAAGRLAVEWNIPPEIAMQIIRGVLQGGECFVRGRRPAEMGPRDISKEISGEFGSTFSPAFLFSREFVDVEIDWNDLLKHGRKLVPGEWEYRVSATKKPAAKRDADREQRATDLVIGLLKANPSMSREDARPACLEKFPDLGKNAFDRVWLGARHALGLGRAMSPGRPKL